MTDCPDGSGRRLSAAGLDVCLEIPDPEAFKSAAWEWLSDLPGVLAPAAWEEALRSRRAPFRGKPLPVWPDFEDFREPVMIWGQIIVAPEEWHGMRVWQRRVSPRNLDWLAAVLADRPVTATVALKRVDANGNELPGGLGLSVEAALDPAGHQIPVARLRAGDSLSWRSDPQHSHDEEVSARLAGLARQWGARSGVLALFGGEDAAAKGATALAHSLEPPMKWWEWPPRRKLQGYSWITWCPADAVAALGGAQALAASGAFWRVDQMPGGPVLLQISERAADYGMSEARRAFEVLAPALPAGLPRKPANWPDGVAWLVVTEDAARKSGDGHKATQ